jgi:hypothetical protein
MKQNLKSGLPPMLPLSSFWSYSLSFLSLFQYPKIAIFSVLVYSMMIFSCDSSSSIDDVTMHVRFYPIFVKALNDVKGVK